MNDQDLLDDFFVGGLKSLEEVYQRIGRMLYSLSYNMVNNHHLAEDLVHDIFLILHKNRKRLNSFQDFKNWASRITINTTLNYLKQNKRRKELIAQKYNQSLSVDMEKLSDETGILSVLKDLSYKHRIILVLTEIEEMSYQEVAQILRIPMGTVRSRLNRAKLILKQKYQEKYGEF